MTRMGGRGLLFLLIVLLSGPGRALGQEDGKPSACVTCHSQLDEELAAATTVWQNDVHRNAGLGCVGCHGGNASPELAEDAEGAMDPGLGFRPSPGRLQVAEFCGRCHSDASFMKKYHPQARVDQLAEYRTSVHGIKNAKGDPVPATCIDCHGIHGIRSVSSPTSPVYAANVPETCARCHSDAAVMAPYGIPTNQYDEYRRSVHASSLIERGDLAAPACNDCHGNHGAVPPGVQSVANVCGQCHGREAILFRDSPKKDLFDGLEVAECTVCHNHHWIVHPTPELFHSDSAPSVSQGTIIGTNPLVVHLGTLEGGEKAEVTWRSVLAPHIDREDERLIHRVEVSAHGIQPIFLDATVRPDDMLPAAEKTRQASSPASIATLDIESLSGTPVQAGDVILFRLTVKASEAVGAIQVRDLPGEAIDPVVGSACLNCHPRGDPCDQATDRMYQAIGGLDRKLREASALLHEAEVAGVEVSGAIFELKSKGTTAAVEARALLHSFDPDRLVKRTQEGEEIADRALEAARSALAEVRTRRLGLAVMAALGIVIMLALYLRIRRLGRGRQVPAVGGGSDHRQA